MADLFHSGNARMTNLPVDLQLRTGEFDLQVCPGPFWALHAPARAFFERLFPEGPIPGGG